MGGGLPGRRIEYPRMVAIETTNRCNAHCTFCPNNALSRTRENMSDDLFEHIVDGCREFPLHAIEPLLNGEPFMDRKILERLERIRSRLPRTRLRLYTNGYLLTRERIDALAELHLDSLTVSLNTLDPATYREVMGLDLERTLGNLAYLTDPVRRGKVARELRFRMTRLPDTSLADQEAFVAYCREHGVRPMLVGLFNYKSAISSPLPVPGYACEHITRLDVLSNGIATLCCMDHEGEYPWGDLNRDSVLEAFNSAEAWRYRDAHRAGRRRSVPPCDTCNLFWPSLDHMPLARRVTTAAQAGWYFLRHRPTGRKAPIDPVA
jgi:molybdenum cofactor biosynthesis enzyme MoaA